MFDQQFWTDSGFLGGPFTSGSLLTTTIPEVQSFLSSVQSTTGMTLAHLTGYSLGGGIAQIFGSIRGIDTVTFNAPGSKLAVQTLQSSGILPNAPPPALNANIRNYRVLGDVISLLPGLSTQLGEVITLPTSASLNPVIPQVFWGPFHDINTVISEIDMTPLSVLTPDQDGSTNTFSLLLEEEADFGIDLTQGISALSSLVLGKFVSGVDHFLIDVVKGNDYPFQVDDPPALIGFNFASGAGDPNFASLLLPQQTDPYNIQELIHGIWIDEGFVSPLTPFNFGPGGVDEFKILNVDADPNIPLTFIAALSFVGDGQFTGTAAPSYPPTSSIPEPSTMVLLGLPLAFILVVIIVHRLRDIAEVYK